MNTPPLLALIALVAASPVASAASFLLDFNNTAPAGGFVGFTSSTSFTADGAIFEQSSSGNPGNTRFVDATNSNTIGNTDSVFSNSNTMIFKPQDATGTINLSSLDVRTISTGASITFYGMDTRTITNPTQYTLIASFPSSSFSSSQSGSHITVDSGFFTAIRMDVAGSALAFDNVAGSTVPEPSAVLLTALGACGLLRRRK